MSSTNPTEHKLYSFYNTDDVTSYRNATKYFFQLPEFDLAFSCQLIPDYFSGPPIYQKKIKALNVEVLKGMTKSEHSLPSQLVENVQAAIKLLRDYKDKFKGVRSFKMDMDDLPEEERAKILVHQQSLNGKKISIKELNEEVDKTFQRLYPELHKKYHESQEEGKVVAEAITKIADEFDVYATMTLQLDLRSHIEWRGVMSIVGGGLVFSHDSKRVYRLEGFPNTEQWAAIAQVMRMV